MLVQELCWRFGEKKHIFLFFLHFLWSWQEIYWGLLWEKKKKSGEAVVSLQGEYDRIKMEQNRNALGLQFSEIPFQSLV